MERYCVQFGLLLTVFGGWHAYVYWKTARDKRKAQAIELAKGAIAKLKQQKITAEKDDKGVTMRCVAVPQLRDEMLMLKNNGLSNLEERKRIWSDVVVLVESNTNVRARQTDIYGEIMRVWEWVGTV